MSVPVEAHGCTHLRGLSQFTKREQGGNRSDRFGRLFDQHLAPLFTDPRVLEDIGKLEGIMDGGELELSETVAVGQVFFGQFVDHDITLDVSSSFDRVVGSDAISNVRTPTLDLDCLYGGGPEATPHLYVQDGDFKGVKLITGETAADGLFKSHDLPRIGNVALIGDPRNDENRVVSQIQLAMIRFHNKVCDELHPKYPESKDRGKLFEAAREHVTWHYQWCVVHDFLVNMCGQPVVDQILATGRKFYKPKEPFIPVEFSVAAFRFGHSMVPMKVWTRDQFSPTEDDTAFDLFGDEMGKGFSPIGDLRAVCDMHELFLTHEGRPIQKASKMDAKLAKELLKLNMQIVGESEASLATRNLMRGQTHLLPSGEAVAAEMGVDQAQIDLVSDAIKAAAPDLAAGTPLWLYILKEAELIGRAVDGGSEPGEGLGPVGAQIVAEVIIGLIELDDRSWLSRNRNWRPETYADDPQIPIATVGNMLAYAQPELPEIAPLTS